MTLERERREPATEAGRELLGKHLDYERSAEYRFMLDAILAIEAQATDARVAALVEALDDMAAAEENEQKRAYIRKLLSDLPAAAAERDRRVVDGALRQRRKAVTAEFVGRIRTAINDAEAERMNHFLDWAYDSVVDQERRDAAAAEFARLSEADR